ncbi:hypothetical protein DPMN_104905 [Dreissena polymorpha]|uniref:Uncharacterized protein n=1 Tax=Dreissena polymorpha TaxID=45954 RepID=A0A9D4K0G1_DREPO|nr:hypothetical protein DPMN_104905 [Dreissena polymorpha]
MNRSQEMSKMDCETPKKTEHSSGPEDEVMITPLQTSHALLTSLPPAMSTTATSSPTPTTLAYSFSGSQHVVMYTPFQSSYVQLTSTPPAVSTTITSPIVTTLPSTEKFSLTWQN